MADLEPAEDTRASASRCVNHQGIQATAPCVNCQRLYCASCLNPFGQCAPCGTRFPQYKRSRSTVAEAEAARIGRGRKPRVRRFPRLALARFAAGGLILAAIGAVAYFQFDLIKRSLPGAKQGASIAARRGAPPRGADGTGKDYDALMSRIEANTASPEDERKLERLMQDVQSGKENFSSIDPARAARGDPPAEGGDEPGSFDEGDDGFSVGEPQGEARAARPAPIGKLGTMDWPPLKAVGTWLSRARDGLMGLVAPAKAQPTPAPDSDIP